MNVRIAVHINRSTQLQELIHLHFAEDWQHCRLFWRVVFHCRQWVALLAAVAPGAALPGVRVFLCRLQGRSYSGRVPCIKCSNCWPPSSLLSCCLQSRFWPGSTGVQLVMQEFFRASNSHPLTVVSLVLLEACKYPEMCAVPPSSGTSYEYERSYSPGINLLSCASSRNGEENKSNVFCRRAGDCKVKSNRHVLGRTRGSGYAATCAILKLECFNGLSQLQGKVKRGFPELHEGIEGNHTRCLYSTLSSCIRGFQDIEMRQPKLFNANFACKMMEFQWYCLSRAH